MTITQDEANPEIASDAKLAGVAKVLRAIAKAEPQHHDMLGEVALFLKHGMAYSDLESWALGFRLLAERNYCFRIGPMWKFKRAFRASDVVPLLEWGGIVRAYDRRDEARG